MKVYIDADYKCHTDNDGSLQEVETSYFDGKCKNYIEGYRYLPSGETWTRDDGEIFYGEMIWPWREFSLLEKFQRQYEELIAQQEDMKAALELLGVTNEEETT